MTFKVDGWEDQLPMVVETEASDDEVGHICFSVQLCKRLCYSGHGGYKVNVIGTIPKLFLQLFVVSCTPCILRQ